MRQIGRMERTSKTNLIGPLYHGTRRQSAEVIVRAGFRRSRSRSYTGIGVCLSESISIAYEYGMYETGGSVVEAWIAADARWQDGDDPAMSHLAVERDSWGAGFIASGLDALRTFSGNVWVVWNPAVLVHRRRLSQREALRVLCAEFDSDGPEVGYNGVVDDYATLWWQRTPLPSGLSRFEDYHQRLRRNLIRAVGRTTRDVR